MSESFQNLYDINNFVDQSLEYIKLERNEEDKITKNIIGNNTNKYLEEKGILLTNMKIVEVNRGLYGRTIISLEKNNSNTLPSHKFTPGDAVAIITKDMKKSYSNSNDDKQSFIRGLVYRISPSKIIVTLSQKSENDEIILTDDIRIVSIAMIGNDVTFKRMEIALKQLVNLNQENNLSMPLKYLFDPNLTNIELIKSDINDPEHLNESQIEAIKFALQSQHFALIHGPPGTGKTTTVVEFIYRSVLEGKKVLACAPSNIAVDNLVDKLSKYNISIVRIGHPARILETTLLYCLDDLYIDTNDYEVTKTMREDMKKKEKEIRDTSEAWKRKQMWKEFRETKTELKHRETIGLKRVIESANVVLSTCVGADDRTLRDTQFDVVVVDEAGQGVDPVVLIPMLKGKKVVLAGDHLQLPPTIKSTDATQKNLCTSTFFERMMITKPNFSRLLKVQYRMNEKIMLYSSKTLYNNELIADPKVKDHTLLDLQSVKSNDNLGMDEDLVKNPLIFVDTAGCSLYESGDSGESKYNEGEADIVEKVIEKLLACGLEENHIGVISPYNAQVDLIKSKVKGFNKNKSIEIHSVDSFQGREKEAIIISLVRSNEKREIGFLSLDNRMNVAFTRARRLLLVIGDSETLNIHPFFKNFIDFCDKEGEYWSAHEFLVEEPLTDYQPMSNIAIIEPQPLKITEQKVKQTKPQNNHPKKAYVRPKKVKTKQVQSKTTNNSNDFDILKDDNTVHKSLASETIKSNVNNSIKKKTTPKQQNPTKKTGKATAKKGQTKAEKALKEIDDDDELLDYFGKQSQKCGLYGCNESIRLLSEICKYCKEKFCMSHVMPELHGCGEEASKHQKEQYMKGGNQKKSTPSWHKDALKTKLHKKIESSKGKRTKTPNEKKK